jgi:DNA-binding NarL/FixJ family response regulator
MPQTPSPQKLVATRILLVDDHPVVRDGLAEAINREPDLTVCAMAEDHAAALRAVEATRPRLAVVDLMLKNSSGFELIKDLRARWPELLILVVSMHEDNVYAARVLRAGARGYMTKQQATRDVLVAIRRVLEGGIYLNEKAALSLVERLASKPESAGGSVAEVLSERELQVFEMTGQGLGTREIAAQLHVDLKTVETYRGRIKEKLNLGNASELLQLAIRWNQERG